MDYSRFDNADPTQRQERGSNLTHAGEHILEVVDIRENNGGLNTPGGYGFFVDLKVISGPTAEGHLFTKKWFPMAAPQMGANGKTIPQNIKTERDFGAMKRWIGAFFGIDPKDAGKLKAEITNVVLRNSVSANGQETPLKGRRVKAFAKAYKATTFVDEVTPVVDTVHSEVTQVKAVAPAIDHTARALAEGFLPHPSAPGYLYRGQTVKSEADIKAGNF